MTPSRSKAYGRVISALDASGRLDDERRAAIREAADDLLFASAFGPVPSRALAIARAILLTVREGEYDPWVEQLGDDLIDAGPDSFDSASVGGEPARSEDICLGWPSR